MYLDCAATSVLVTCGESTVPSTRLRRTSTSTRTGEKDKGRFIHSDFSSNIPNSDFPDFQNFGTIPYFSVPVVSKCPNLHYFPSAENRGSTVYLRIWKLGNLEPKYVAAAYSKTALRMQTRFGIRHGEHVEFVRDFYVCNHRRKV